MSNRGGTILTICISLVSASIALVAALYLVFFRVTPFGELRDLTKIGGEVRFEVDPEKTIKAIELRLARDPEAPITLAELSRAYLSLGVVRHDPSLIERAERLAEQSLELASFRNLSSTEVLARIASYRHNFSKAIDLSDRIISEGAVQGYEIKIAALLALKRVQEAQECASEYLKIVRCLSSLLQIGLVAEAKGELDQAEQYYRDAIAADTSSSREASLWSRAILARFFIRNHRLEEGEVVLHNIETFDDKYPMAKGLKGDLKLARGDVEGAIELFRSAYDLSRDPTFLLKISQMQAGISETDQENR